MHSKYIFCHKRLRICYHIPLSTHSIEYKGFLVQMYTNFKCTLTSNLHLLAYVHLFQMYTYFECTLTSNVHLLQTQERALPAQDRGPFWFSYILNEILQYIEVLIEFKV